MKRISKKISIRERGITLVALVITVIILLILAGVTVTTALGQNGLFKRAKLAKEEYEVATERDALGLTVIAYKMNREEKDANNEKIGITLYDRNLDNGKNWNIVVENKNYTIYGTDWNYIEKGTEVQGYGRTKYNWVVNYETGETIRLEDKSYTNWNYKKTVAVTDNLLLNLDSANVGEIKESWGKDTKLYYYDTDIYDTMEKRKDAYEEQKGKDVTNDNIGYDRQISDNIENYLDRDKGAFKFSGNNYLELFNDEGYDFSKGLTFEFYGMWSKGTWTFGNGRTEEQINEVAEGPLFALWNGKHNELGAVRFRSEHIGFEDSYFLYSLGGSSAEFGPEDYGDFAEGNDLHNQRCYISGLGSTWGYFTVSINPIGNSERVNQEVFMNGELVQSGTLSRKWYDAFVNQSKKEHYVEIGRCQVGEPGVWVYMNGSCYVVRLYNIGLNKEQVMENYKITKEWHDFISKSKSVER